MVAKPIYLVAKLGNHITDHLPSVQVVVRFKTKHNPIMPLTIWNYVCLTSSQVIFKEKTGFYIPEITVTTGFPGSNVLLPVFSIGSK